MGLAANRLIERLFDFLRNADIEIRLANIKKPHVGMCESVERPIIILLSPWPSSEPTNDGIPICPVASLIHEALHGMFPDWKHSTVISRTKKIWEKLTVSQKLELYEKIFEPTRNGSL